MIVTLLAQITPDALHIAGGLASMFFVIGGVNTTLKLVDRLRGQPNPERLQPLADALHRRLDQLEAAREHDLREAEERRRAIYAQLDRTRLELKQDIQAVESKIATMPAEIVALLRNTGAL